MKAKTAKKISLSCNNKILNCKKARPIKPGILLLNPSRFRGIVLPVDEIRIYRKL